MVVFFNCTKCCGKYDAWLCYVFLGLIDGVASNSVESAYRVYNISCRNWFHWTNPLQNMVHWINHGEE